MPRPSKYLCKQDIKSIPFHILQEQIFKEKQLSILEAENKLKASIQRIEQSLTVNSEASFEGNVTDQYSLPVEDKSKISKRVSIEQTGKFIEDYGLQSKASWLLPQLAAYISSMKLNKNYDGFQFLNDNFAKDNWHKGLYHICTSLGSRGLLVPKQYSSEYKNYSALIPLIMMPFKRDHNVPYSKWINFKSLLDQDLYSAIYDVPEFTEELKTEDILYIREKGLYIKSGSKAGTLRDPITTYKLFGLSSSSSDITEQYIATLPRLSQVMLTQIWVAHPSIRTSLMILNWKNLDNMPVPLITEELFKEPEPMAMPKPTNSYHTEPLPWE